MSTPNVIDDRPARILHNGHAAYAETRYHLRGIGQFERMLVQYLGPAE